MVFTIRQYSTLPILKMKLIANDEMDYEKFYNRLENSVVTFSMIDEKTEVYKILNQNAFIKISEKKHSSSYPFEIYICYQFCPSDVYEIGYYKAEFRIDFMEGFDSLNIPIREDLYINVVKSIVLTSISGG